MAANKNCVESVENAINAGYIHVIPPRYMATKQRLEKAFRNPKLIEKISGSQPKSGETI